MPVISELDLESCDEDGDINDDEIGDDVGEDYQSHAREESFSIIARGVYYYEKLL